MIAPMASSTSDDMEPALDRTAVGYVLRLGRALHSAGTPADRLEEALDDASERLGLQGQFFTTPTSLFAAFGPVERQRTHLMRVQPAAVDLGRLAALHKITRDVRRGRTTIADAIRRIETVAQSPAPYHWTIVALASATASAAGCRFLGGGLAEIRVAFAVGLVIGILMQTFRRLPRPGNLPELSAAFVASLLVSLLFVAGYRSSIPITTLAGVLIVLPGLTLTTAMTELASRHLAAGTARLSGAFVVFLALAVGVALASAVVGAWYGPLRPTAVVRLPEWTLYTALATMPIAFAILLGARPRDLPVIYLASIVAFGSMQAGQRALGVELGAVVGSFAVAILANAYERFGWGAAQVPLTPGVLLLVPGSLGFRSMTALLDANTMAGVDTAFSMLLTAISLAAGLLVASVFLPPSSRARVKVG